MLRNRVDSVVVAVAACSVFLTMAASPQSASANTIYNFTNTPSQQDGWDLAGTITTDGTIGPLTAANIVAWSFTFQNMSTHVGLSIDVGASAYIAGNIIASSTEITVANPGVFGAPNDLMLTDPAPFGSVQLHYGRSIGFSGAVDRYSGYANGSLWASDSASNVGGADPWIIATAAPVPEPATAWLLLVGGGAWLAAARRCRSRGTRRDVAAQ